MTPDEYYKTTFPKDYNLIKDIKTSNLFSFETCMKLMEMYHWFEIDRIVKKKKPIQ